MKTILLLFALSTSCFALTNTPPGMLPPLPPPPPPKPAPVKPVSVEVRNFNANEFNVDVYGALSRPNLIGAPQWGEGIGVAYFVTRGLGAGLSATTYNNDGVFIDESELSIIFRAPLWDTVAPYARLAGVWMPGNHGNDGDWGAGAYGGIELRLNKHIGLFGEIGLRVTTEGDDSTLSRFGFRGVF